MRWLLLIVAFLAGCGGTPLIKVNPLPPSCEYPNGGPTSPDQWVGAVCDTWGETFGFERETQLFLVFNKDFEILERMSCGGDIGVGHVSCSVRSVSRLFRAVKGGAYVIHFHNHIFHAPRPYFGKGDYKAIGQIDKLARENGLELYDAVVLLPGRLTSARHEGSL